MPRKPAMPGIDRRQQILNAALDVFAERGFEGATTQEIAERAEVAQGLIYFYFKQGGKVQLLLAACEKQAAIALAQLDDKSADERGSSLAEMVGRFVRVLGAPRTGKLLSVMAREVDRVPAQIRQEDNDTISILALRVYNELVEFLLTNTPRDALSEADASVAANLFAGALIALMIRRALGEANATYMSQDDIIRIFTEMLGAWLASKQASND